MATSIARHSTLVGRSDEMQRLEAALGRASARHGCAIFLSGESGIGKTRLGQEAMAVARACRFTTLQGSAYPLDGSLAFAVIVDALGPFLRAQTPASKARLVNGLPDLGRLFTDLNLPPPELLRDPALERTRLFEAVARLIERLAEETPVALFVDDLHWADSASLELLHYVARDLCNQPVLILATYRSDDLDAARRLRPVVRSLQRAGLSEEIVVRSLRVQDVNAMARSLLGGEVLPETLEYIAARAGGTPLFVEALVRFLVDTGHLIYSGGEWGMGRGAPEVLPSSIRELILERLERLDPVARRVLDLIAVSADVIPHALLESVCSLENDDLLVALQRLRSAGLLVQEMEQATVAYSLNHPLIQEVAYGELAELALQRAHASFALSLERLYPDKLQQLARHYRGAGPEADPARAFEVLVAAGERAREVHANDEAARHFSAALALVRNQDASGNGNQNTPSAIAATGSSPNGGPPALPWLLGRYGEASWRIGESDSAIASMSEALSGFEKEGKTAAAARLRHALAMIEWDRGRFETAEAHLEAGLAALTGRPPSQEKAHLLWERIFLLQLSGRLDSLASTVAELESVADRLGSPGPRVDARLGQVSLHVARRQFADARECGLRALSIAEESGEALLALRVHNFLALLALPSGDHARLRYHAERGLRLARDLGAPALETLPRCHLTFADLLAGDLEVARRDSFEAVLHTRRVEQRRVLALALAARAIVLALSGELAEATGCIAEARAIFGQHSTSERFLACMIGVAELTIANEQGGTEALRTAAERYAPFLSCSLVDFNPLIIALMAEGLAIIGDPEQALRLARELADAVTVTGLDYPAALAARVQGIARQAMGEREAAMGFFEQAATIFRRIGMSFDADRARLAWATLATHDDPAGAASIAQECWADFELAGARLYAARARRLLASLGVHRQMGGRTTQAAIKQAPPGIKQLSAREFEVARLVADGLTSAEIAERLTISPRTVTTHLERIYTRLGIKSRASLVRYLGDNVLLPSLTKVT